MADGRFDLRRSPLVTLLTVLLGVLVLFALVQYLFAFVISLVLGGAIYYLFGPLVSAAEKRGVPRALAASLAMVVVLGGFGFAGFTLVPRVYAELSELAEDLPEYGERADQWLRDSPLDVDEEDPVGTLLDDAMARADDAAADIVNAALGAVTGVVESFFALLFGFVVGFYLLLGGPRVAERLPRWFPPSQRDRWLRFGREASTVLSGYLRARLIASIFIGTAYGTAFWLLGLPEPILLGVVGGVLNLVPIVGPILAAIPALIVAAFQGWPIVLAVLAVMVVAQQIESSLIDPHLEGRYVKLDPTTVVLVVAFGSAVAGIAGILLAVPIAGLVRAALESFYLDSWGDGTVTVPRSQAGGREAPPPPRERVGGAARR